MPNARVCAALIVALLFVAGSVLPASAATKRSRQVTSTVDLSALEITGGGEFTTVTVPGIVSTVGKKAFRSPCRDDRKVQLVRETDRATPVGAGRTARSGAFRVSGVVPQGQFFWVRVLAAKVEIKVGRHTRTVRCRGTSTEAILIPPPPPGKP